MIRFIEYTKLPLHSRARRRSAKKPIRRALALLAVAGTFGATGCANAPSNSTAPTTTTLKKAGATSTSVGPTVVRPDAFFGFNGASIIRNTNIDLLMNPKLQSQLATFPTRLIRIPSGTAAQWIDWRTGKFIAEPTSPFASIGSDRHPVTMNDWATLIKTTHATPVWDLNVLTATLDDQIAMLHHAQGLGMKVRYIELGNELWDTRSIYPKVYPSGTAYAQAMNSWIPTLRAQFPSAKIAVSGADPSDSFFTQIFGKRYATWNNEVTATIRGADAIAIHPYWTLPNRTEPGSNVAATLSAGVNAWQHFSTTTLGAIPSNLHVWLTEWNEAAWGVKTGKQIWAQALSVVAVASQQLTDPRISLSLVHNIVDGVMNPQDAGTSIPFPAFTDGADGSVPMQRTALGIALPLLFGAVTPHATVTLLKGTNANNTKQSRLVTGVLIGGPSPGALYVNRSSQPIVVQLPGTLTNRWHAIELYAAPDAEPGWNTHDLVTHTTTSITEQVALPAYSIVRITRSG